MNDGEMQTDEAPFQGVTTPRTMMMRMTKSGGRAATGKSISDARQPFNAVVVINMLNKELPEVFNPIGH